MQNLLSKSQHLIQKENTLNEENKKMSNILTYEGLTLGEVLQETGTDPLTVATDDYYEVVKDILNGLADWIYIIEVPTDDDEIRKMSL